MKKYNLTFMFLIVWIATHIKAQEWKQEYPIPTNVEFHNLHFTDSTRGWLVGEAGTILVSDDAGNHWANQNATTTNTLYGVTFVDQEEGWIVGENSTILHTIDAGNTWQPQTSLTNLILKEVQFIDAQHGWAMANAAVILRTTDGGNTWFPSTVSTGLNLKDFIFIDANNGWVAGDTSVWKSVDGGQSWIEQPIGGNVILEAIDFIDENIGWATGGMGSTYRTTDGGNTWNLHHIITANNYPIIDVNFYDSLYGVCVRGNYGLLFETRDGGVNWDFLSANIQHNVFFLDSSYAWSIGDYNSKRTLSRSENGGKNWNNLYQNSTQPFEDICAINKNEVWAVGKAGVVYSSDIGLTWEPRGTGISTPCYEIEFSDNGQDGWMITTWLRIYKTIDGGDTWTRSQSLGTGIVTEHLYELDFINDQIGWVGSSYGTIYKTIDAGVNWQPVASGFFRTKVLQFSTAQKGWMADAANTYQTVNGGNTWSIDINFTNQQLQDLFFLDSLHGWAVGHDFAFNKLLFRTDDAGNSWAIDTLPSALPKHVTFADPLQGWMADVNGDIWYSEDGGRTWLVQPNRAVSKINALAAADSVHCWAVGTNSTILRYQDCTIDTPVISKNSNGLSTSVYQNYQWLLNGTEVAGATQQNHTPSIPGVYTVLVDNGHNCLSSSLGFVMDASLIAAHNDISTDKIDAISLYPNPSTGLIIAEIKETAELNQLHVVNLSGQLVAKYLIEGMKEQIHIDLSDSVNGMYLLQFIYKNGAIETQKIILQK